MSGTADPETGVQISARAPFQQSRLSCDNLTYYSPIFSIIDSIGLLAQGNQEVGQCHLSTTI